MRIVRFLCTLMAVSMLIGVTCLAGCQSEPAIEWKDDEVAMIEGKPLSKERFLMYLRDQKAAAAQQFASSENGSPGEDFWNEKKDGQSPLEWAKEKALDQAAQDTTLFIQAEEAGLYPYPDDAILQEALKSENEAREQALESQEPVYGTTSFDEYSYLLYLRKQLNGELQKQYVEKSDIQDPKLLEQIFEEQKDQLTGGASYELRVIYSDGQTEEVTLNPSEIGKEETEKQEALKALQDAKPGDVLQDQSWQGRPATIVLQSVAFNEKTSWKDYEQPLKELAAARAYQKECADRADRAKIVINHAVYDGIEMP